jgi:large subunit ribosomal protein L15
MQLHQLERSPYRRIARRVGRGGKRGTTSGRGQKGQKSRSGRRIRPAVRDLIIRTPKLRGFKNKPVTTKPIIFDVAELARTVRPAASAGQPFTLDMTILKSLGLVPNRYRGAVKVLGRGPIGIALVLKGMKTSASARAAIEKAGGTVADKRGPDADKRGKNQRESA